MIKIVCDDCSHRFEVDESKAGRMVACPKCEYVNAVPLRGASGADAGQEVALARFRPAMFRAHPLTFIGLFILVLGGLGLIAFGLIQGPSFWWMVGALLFLLGVVSLAVWKIRTLAVTLEVTTMRTMLIRGLFSKRTAEVMHRNVRNLQVEQSFVDRLLDVGAIGISSAGEAGIEIEARDLPSPFKIRGLINEHRKHA